MTNEIIEKLARQLVINHEKRRILTFYSKHTLDKMTEVDFQKKADRYWEEFIPEAENVIATLNILILDKDAEVEEGDIVKYSTITGFNVTEIQGDISEYANLMKDESIISRPPYSAVLQEGR